MVVGTIGGVFTTLRRRVSVVVSTVLVGSAGVVVTGAASSASAVRAAAPSSTVWLCRPGLADETASTSSGATLVADPCEADLGTTIVRADGSTTMVFAKPAKHTPIDCFYVYPTVSDQSTTNADLTIDPQEIAVAEQQTSRFSQVCRVFAPMYRQVTIPALLHGDLGSAAARLTAYNDVLNAWRDYLAHDNHGRGVVFIGHSQGSDMLIRLLRNEIDPNPARRRQMVSALLLGGNVTVKKGSDVGGAFHHIVACHAANQTGCVVAYSSFDAAPPANALFGRVRSASAVLAGNAAVDPKLQVLCVNPANLAGGRRVEDVLVVLGREAVDLDDPLAQLGALAGLGRLAPELDPGSLGEQLEGTSEVGLLGHLDELEDVAALPAAKAVPGLLLGRHPEAGGVLLVEGAEAEELVAHLPEPDVLADDLDEVGAGADLLFGVILSCHGRHPDGI